MGIGKIGNLWWDAWNDIIYLMDHNEMSGISAFDQKFSGTQSVFNWASDFDMELQNAGIDDKNYLERRIAFCSEYVKRSEDKKHLNIEIQRELNQLGKNKHDLKNNIQTIECRGEED